MTTTRDTAYRRTALFIGGRWESSLDGEVVAVVDPATGAEIGSAQLAGVADIDRAVHYARTSFDSGVWSTLPAADRAAILRDAADRYLAKSALAVELLIAELGCVRAFAEHAAVPNPARHLRYYADLIEAEPAGLLRDDGTNRSFVVYEPVGVVAAITPWNSPISSATMKIGPALAAGCSVVLKPPPETPLAISLLADAFAEAGLPAGVFNLVPGDREAGEHLVRHPEVDKLAFTGSTAVGRHIMALGAGRVARVTLELGGKSAAVVLDDADIAATVRGLLPMTSLVNGQACILQSRILVPRRIEAQFTEAFCAAYTGLRVGLPSAADTQVGPLVSAAQRDRVEGYVALAAEEGAGIVGGGRPEGLTGYYVNPTVLTGVRNDMRVAREEIFGPVVAIIGYDEEDEAVALANDSVYGLSGSVWSSDPERALAVARRLRTGGVVINGAPQSSDAPFGGAKQSGIGRENGPEGIAAYRESKSISLEPGFLPAEVSGA